MLMGFPKPLPGEGKFSTEEVAALRTELIHSGLDSWQAAELISSFLAARGYGISPIKAREAFQRIDASHCTLQNMRDELEHLALMM